MKLFHIGTRQLQKRNELMLVLIPKQVFSNAQLYCGCSHIFIKLDWIKFSITKFDGELT